MIDVVGVSISLEGNYFTITTDKEEKITFHVMEWAKNGIGPAGWFIPNDPSSINRRVHVINDYCIRINNYNEWEPIVNEMFQVKRKIWADYEQYALIMIAATDKNDFKHYSYTEKGKNEAEGYTFTHNSSVVEIDAPEWDNNDEEYVYVADGSLSGYFKAKRSNIH